MERLAAEQLAAHGQASEPNQSNLSGEYRAEICSFYTAEPPARVDAVLRSERRTPSSVPSKAECMRHIIYDYNLALGDSSQRDYISVHDDEQVDC